MGKVTNIAGVRAAKAGAKSISPPPPDDDAGTNDAELPPDCPVRALGKDGKTRYYLDADRQLIALADRDHSRLGILGLFGRKSDLLYGYWPRHNKDGAVTGWRPELASEALMSACSSAGVWEAQERQRGRGAWLGDGGELVLHTGTHVMTFPASPTPYADHTSDRAGLVGRYVYSAAGSVGVPAIDAALDGPDGAAEALLKTLKSWRWRRGEIDAVLMLGWIGAAMIGGALKWRPMGWLTGGKGTGKSTLQDLLRGVFGGGLIQTADTTSAGLYQTLRHQTLPIAVDELEAEEDNRRNTAVVKLARLAASGALMLRGGQDHNATEFVVRSSFLFSSILIPPLTGQDRSRISVLELDELPPGAEAPKLDQRMLATLGAQLRRRMVDGWNRWPRTLDTYRGWLQADGHNARGADQLGTLLAAADLLLFDDVDSSSATGAWITELHASETAEAEDNARDEDRCLAFLLSSPVDVVRNGARRTVGEWVRIAAEVDGDGSEIGDAVRVLGSVGLRIVAPTPKDDRHSAQPLTLAIANFHKGLAAAFAGSHWQATSATNGVWVQAMRRLPGATRANRTLYFGGSTSKCVLVPLSIVLPLDTVDPRHYDRLLRTP